ncbi:hypothetical protein ACSU64_05700 [Bacillaceae bacterium C204]|uniref:hypothetical protein n=1 Tax=Neobacillus sp. 204 TaxID=3383351 RepID=UPI0039781CF6
MTNEKMVMNQFTINTFDFSTLSREQLEGLFTNFVGAKLVLTDCDGKETSFSVMEVLERETQYCDSDGIEIYQEDCVL